MLLMCKNRICFIMGATETKVGTGDVKMCSYCKSLYAPDGSKIEAKDLPKHNPGHEENLIDNVTDEE